METEQNISESAFLVNVSRARNIELSQNHYAHLWVTNATRALWEEPGHNLFDHDFIKTIRYYELIENTDAGACGCP